MAPHRTPAHNKDTNRSQFKARPTAWLLSPSSLLRYRAPNQVSASVDVPMQPAMEEMVAPTKQASSRINLFYKAQPDTVPKIRISQKPTVSAKPQSIRKKAVRKKKVKVFERLEEEEDNSAVGIYDEKHLAVIEGLDRGREVAATAILEKSNEAFKTINGQLKQDLFAARTMHKADDSRYASIMSLVEGDLGDEQIMTVVTKKGKQETTNSKISGLVTSFEENVQAEIAKLNANWEAYHNIQIDYNALYAEMFDFADHGYNDVSDGKTGVGRKMTALKEDMRREVDQILNQTSRVTTESLTVLEKQEMDLERLDNEHKQKVFASLYM